MQSRGIDAARPIDVGRMVRAIRSLRKPLCFSSTAEALRGCDRQHAEQAALAFMQRRFRHGISLVAYSDSRT
jgi:hypothetical protein